MTEQSIRYMSERYEIPAERVLAAAATGASNEELNARFSREMTIRVLSQDAEAIGYRLVKAKKNSSLNSQ